MNNLNVITEQIVSTSIIPVVMIPACTLLSMIFNNRLMAILSSLTITQHDLLDLKYKFLKNKRAKESEIEAFFYYQDRLWNEQSYSAHSKRAHLLRCGIVSEYCGIFVFATAAICILLSFFSQTFSYVSGCLLVVGIIFVMTGLSFGLREILMALASLSENSKIIEKLSDEMYNKFSDPLS
jgi:hypothetical protein